MHIKIDAKLLRSCLDRGVSKKGALPILSMALIDVYTEIKISTTDMQAYLTETLDGETLSPGKICASVDKLKSALTGLAGDVELRMDNAGQLLLLSGRKRYVIPTLPADDFPLPEEKEGKAAEHVDGLSLAGAINRVKYASGKNDARYYLNGIAFNSGHVVATDGCRMAWIPSSIKLECIVSRDAVDNLVAALCNGDCKMSLGKMLHVKAHNMQFSVAVIDGRYPDWQQVLLSDSIWSVSFQAKEAAGVLGRMSAFIDGKQNASTAISLQSVGGLLTIKFGDNQEEIDCTGPNTEAVGFEPRYVKDLITCAGYETITWSGRSATSGHAFEISERSDKHIIMPRRF